MAVWSGSSLSLTGADRRLDIPDTLGSELGTSPLDRTGSTGTLGFLGGFASWTRARAWLGRVCAWLIDVTVLALVVFIGAVVLAVVVGPTVRFGSDVSGSDPLATTDRGMVIISVLVSTSLSAAYSVVPWLVWGASPGQLVLGLRVRSDDAGALTPAQAVTRWLLLFPPVGAVAALADVPNLAALLWGSTPIWYVLLLLTTIRNRRGQGLHDRLAGTIVGLREVPAREVPAREVPSTREVTGRLGRCSPTPAPSGNPRPSRPTCASSGAGRPVSRSHASSAGCRSG